MVSFGSMKNLVTSSMGKISFSVGKKDENDIEETVNESKKK